MQDHVFLAALSQYELWRERIVHISREELLNEQERLCRELLVTAQRTTRYWNHRLSEREAVSLPWSEVPFTDRQLITAHFQEHLSDVLLNRDVVQKHFQMDADGYLFEQYQVFLSAGKSGLLTPFVYDRKMWQTFLEGTLRRFLDTGFDIEQSFRIAFVGTVDPVHTLTRTAKLFPSSRVQIFGLQDGLDRCAEELQKWRPHVLYGFSSAVGLLAEEQIQGRLAIHPEVVLIGTDTLVDAHRKVIKQAWGIRPLSSYASTEAGVLAFECSQGNLHINEDLVRAEMIEGKLVITNLVNRVQPFIRYVMPDRVQISETACACGLPYAVLHPLDGRVNHAISLPGLNGREAIIHPIVIRSALDRIPGLRSSEASYDHGNLLIKILGDIDYSEAKSSLVACLLRAGANPDLFTIEFRSE